MKNVLAAAVAAMLLIFTPASQAKESRTIVDVATKAGSFKTLLAAATAAGLADELSEVDDLTVFAPTDAAFAKLPAGTLETLLKPENKDKLRAIIAYHILPNRVYAQHIPRKPALVETLNGCERVRVERTHAGVQVDKVKVVQGNVRASNGVIHVINDVLIPARACP